MNLSFNFSIQHSFSLTTRTTMSDPLKIIKYCDKHSAIIQFSKQSSKIGHSFYQVSSPHLISTFSFRSFLQKSRVAHNNYLANDWLLPLLYSHRSLSRTLTMIASDTGSNHSEKLPMLYLFPFPHLCYLPTDLFSRVLSTMVTLVEAMDSISLLIWMSRPPTLPSKLCMSKS